MMLLFMVLNEVERLIYDMVLKDSTTHEAFIDLQMCFLPNPGIDSTNENNESHSCFIPPEEWHPMQYACYQSKHSQSCYDPCQSTIHVMHNAPPSPKSSWRKLKQKCWLNVLNQNYENYAIAPIKCGKNYAKHAMLQMENLSNMHFHPQLGDIVYWFHNIGSAIQAGTHIAQGNLGFTIDYPLSDYEALVLPNIGEHMSNIDLELPMQTPSVATLTQEVTSMPTPSIATLTLEATKSMTKS
eukprot:scaffold39519_cov59-Attheya_sp.AAC.4